MDRALLKEYGIDYEQGLARCMGDADFFRMLLSMFLRDESFQRAKTACAAGDQKALFAAVHELKGASGTAALTALYDALTPFVELLRDGTADQREIDRLFGELEGVYQRTCEGVTRALEQ